MYSKTSENVAVLGAGLQGACVALELARRGYRVLLIDQSSGCMQRASLASEGKIHLGLVYANDLRACLHKDGFRRLYLCLARKSKFIPAI